MLGPGREVRTGTVAAVAEQLPRVRCPAGHDEPVTDEPEVAAAVRDLVRAAVLRARTRTLRREVCAACGARLTMPVRRSTWPVTVHGIAGVPVFTLRFDLPSTRCPDCGVDQLPGRSHADLDAAITELCVREGRRPPVEEPEPPTG